MNASKFMDKQIMDLSRSKSSDHLPSNNDFIDLMNPQSEQEEPIDSNDNLMMKKKNKDEILPSYDFHPINRPTALHSLSSDFSSKSKSSPLRNYNSLDHVEPDKIILEKDQKVNDSAILSEIERTMKIHIDSVLHAIDDLSARLSQLENRSRHLEHSVDELKVSIGNNHGSADGKLRHLENILLEVQNGVHDLKDKQEVMEGQMQLAKLQISKVEQPSEISSSIHPDQQTSASAPPQQAGFQQFPVTAPQQFPSLPHNIPSNVPPPPQQNVHPSPGTTQFLPGHTSSGPQRDAYFSPSSQTQEVSSQQYQMPPPAQNPQPPHILAPPPQQYQSTATPPYAQLPQPPQQQHPVVGANTAQFSTPLGHRPEEGPYIPPQNYPPNLQQPTAQPSSMPSHSQPYYANPPSMYEPPPSGRSSSGHAPTYGPPSGPPSESYPYGGPPSHYGGPPPVKMQPHSPVGNSSNYPQLPTAKILPSAIPTASGISGGSGSGGSGNRVPIDDVVDKVTNMGFPRDHVKATVRKLTENGQSVDLNVVLDKLMNDGDMQAPKGWFSR